MKTQYYVINYSVCTNNPNAKYKDIVSLFKDKDIIVNIHNVWHEHLCKLHTMCVLDGLEINKKQLENIIIDFELYEIQIPLIFHIIMHKRMYLLDNLAITHDNVLTLTCDNDIFKNILNKKYKFEDNYKFELKNEGTLYYLTLNEKIIYSTTILENKINYEV